MKLKSIAIYPIKGLSGCQLQQGVLRKEQGIAGDRLYGMMAEESMPKGTEDVPWMDKKFFFQQCDWPALASLDCSYSEDFAEITIQGKTFHLQRQQDAFNAFMAAYLRASTPHPKARNLEFKGLKLVGKPGLSRFPDRKKYDVSLLNIESGKQLEEKLSYPIDLRRFRGNFVIEGMEAFEEKDLVGKFMKIGAAKIMIKAPIARCYNIEVNPDTGVSDCQLLQDLRTEIGKSLFGVMASVEEEGLVRIGDEITIE